MIVIILQYRKTKLKLKLSNFIHSGRAKKEIKQKL